MSDSEGVRLPGLARRAGIRALERQRREGLRGAQDGGAAESKVGVLDSGTDLRSHMTGQAACSLTQVVYLFVGARGVVMEKREVSGAGPGGQADRVFDCAVPR